MNAEKDMRFHRQFNLPFDPIPAAVYTSREHYDREIECIFKKDWLWVCRDEEIPNPGDYKVKRLEFANTAIILIRGKDGKVRGFHNVCRHRGNKVVAETGGEETFGRNKAAVVMCRFHGWVYNAEGKLVEVPQREKFPTCFSNDDNGLIPVHTEVWEGFIFINLDPSPEKSLTEFLAPVIEHYEGFPFSELSQVRTYYAHIASNWKVGMDAFMEAYHVPTIHAGSFPGLSHYWQGDVTIQGDHRSIAFYTDGVNPETPVGSLANSIFHSSIALKRDANFDLPKLVNPDRSPYWGFEQMTVFPQTLIHVGHGLWFTLAFWPVTHDTCLWEGKYFLPKPNSNAQRWAQHYAVVLQRNGWLEDTATMEDTQKALKSGVLDKVNLQDDEIMLRHQFEVIKRRVGALDAATGGIA